MADWARQAMRSWAASRGLQFHERGLLPMATRYLCEGRGAGERRASIVRSEGKHSVTKVAGFTKRPERYTENLCSGTLPGGLNGTVCHHMHLRHGYRTSDGDWSAVPDTFVFAHLPEGARPAVELYGNRSPHDGQIKQWGPTVDLSAGQAIVPHSTWLEDIGGFRWRAEPADDPRLLREVVQRASAALAYAPEGTYVEYCEGALLVHVRGVIEDPSVLDTLCHVAAELAEGIRRVTASYAPLDPASPLPPPRDTERSRWVDQGVRTVDWPQPPASITVAQAGYASGVAPHAKRQARKGRAISFVAIAIMFGLFGLIDVLLGIFIYGLVGALVFGFFGALITLPFIFRDAGRAGRIVEREQTVVRARPWGIEAFTRGYAQSRGLVQEDWDEFRHRFDSPIVGRPVRVLFGHLGDGVTGRLVLWIARPDQPPQYYLLAVIPTTATVPPTIPGYETYVRAGALVIAQPVAESERSIERLDALAAAARQAAAAGAAPAAASY